MIIGVALVVEELNKGPRLVLRYPPTIAQLGVADTTHFSKYFNDYISISSENFSKFFRPKAALCNRVLEVNIDELQYITYACTCSVGGSQQGTPGHITLFNVIVVKINDDVLKQSQVKCAPSSNSIRSYSTTNTTKNVVRMYAEILSQLESDERYVSKQVLKMFRVAEGVEDAIRKSNLNSAGTSGSLSVGSYPLYSGSGVSAIVTESMSAQSDGEQSSVLLVGRAESFGRSEGSRNRSSSSAVPLLSVNSSDVLDLTAMTEIGVHTNTISHHQKLSLDTAAVTDITGNMNVQKSRLAAIASAPLHVTPSHHSAVSNNLSSSSVAETVKVKHAADREVIICEVMMAKCPLANEVRTLYHNLIDGKRVHLLVGDRIWLTQSLNTTTDLSSNSHRSEMEMNDVNSRVHTDNMSVSRTDVDEMSGGSAIHLRPYHSMLLYENCTRSLQNLVYLLYNSATSTISSSTIASASASSDIAITSSIVQSESIETSNRESDTKEFLMLPDIYKLFIQSIKPTSTFLELANTLELTLKDVYALATELETLGIGRVIKVVTEDSVYKVHPHADLSSEGLLCHMFTAAFPFNGIELKLHRQPSWVSMTMLQPNGHSELNSDGSRSKSTVSVGNIVPRMSSINGFTASNTPASSSFHRHQSPLSLLNNSNHNNSTNSMQKPRSDDLSVKFTLPNAEQQSTTRNQSIKPFGQIQMNNQSSGSPAALDFLPAISSRYGDSALNTNATNTARYSNINTSRTTNTARIEVESPRSDYQTNRSSTDNLSKKSVFTASGKTIADTGRAPSRPDDEYTLATGRSWAQLSDTRDRASNVPPQSLRRSVGLSEVTVGSTSVFFYVLSLFDGATNVSRYIDKLPGSLKAVSVDILIWLLRFNILQEVQISFVSIDSLSNEPSAHVMTSNTDENRMVSKDDPIEQRNTHSHSVELSELMWRQNLTEGKLRREHVMSALKGKEQVKIETLVSSIQSN